MSKTTRSFLDWLQPNGFIDWLEGPTKVALMTVLVVFAGVLALGTVAFVTQRSTSQALGESLEAEDATITSGAVKIVTDSTVSGGKYVEFLTPSQKLMSKDTTKTCFSGINPTAGVLATTVTVHAAGNYYLWSRINSSSASENSYWLQIDDSCPYSVGGFTQAPTNSWIWVNYRDGNPDAKLTLDLTAGPHTFKLFGQGANFSLDKIVLTSDKTCIPTDLGNNCK